MREQVEMLEYHTHAIRHLANICGTRVTAIIDQRLILNANRSARNILQMNQAAAKIVLLPEPEGPMTAITSPGSTLKDTCFSTSSVPNDFLN